MPSLFQDFGQTAQRLARNPLGIIALFIVLVYGIAGLVLGVSSGNLEPSERQPLVWFLVVFPVVVLAAFYRLVVIHHVKLYAPHDFPDAEGFFRALTPSEQKERLEQEIRELETTSALLEGGKTGAVEMEGTALTHGLSTRHAWVLAEEFAFRELENEFATSIQRQVAVGDYGVDGVFLDKGRLRAVEIKFTKHHQNLVHLARRAADQFGRIADSLKPVFSFILVIVVEGVPPERLEEERARTQEGLKSVPLAVELRVYDFDELKKKYGVDEHRT